MFLNSKHTYAQNDKRLIRAWCSYDIANSAYNLVITTAIFPIFYTQATVNHFGSDTIQLFGKSIINTVAYNYTIALSYLFIVILSPILSGIADFTGKRKMFMQIFTFIGAISCSALYWFKGDNPGYALLFSSLAVIGFAGSLVFYNSFLPYIASPDKQDRVSALGFSYGYGGSLLLLIFCLFMIMQPQLFSISDAALASRISFLLVGCWWFIIAHFAFYYLKDTPSIHTTQTSIFSSGFYELKKTFSTVLNKSLYLKFLSAFLLYSIGVQTIIMVATQFGAKELNISSDKLIITIILLQIIGIVGAFLFGKISEQIGSKYSLIIMVLIWMSVCVGAYFIVSDVQYFILAGGVGMVLGGIQSQSRSAWSKLIDSNNSNPASYFSLYDITEKIAIVLGMATFALSEQLSGNMRISALTMGVFFFLALPLLFSIKGKIKAN
ncbi:MAG: MFS transporter [Bacteroidales bacterium]